MIMQLNDKGQDVLELSNRLAAMHLLAAPSPIFNTDIEAAVRRFQSNHLDPQGNPLVVDGEVGPLTLWSIEASSSGLPSQVVIGRPPLAMPAAGGSVTGRAALVIAIAEYARGAGEIGGDNRGPDVINYLHGIVPQGSSWCAGFVSYCFNTSGHGMTFRYSVGARDVFEQFQHKGWTYAPSVTRPPEPGDIVAWWRDSLASGHGHIGIVHSCENGILRTIEGNRGDYPSLVSTFTYVLGRIDRLLGFGQSQP